MTAVLEGSEWSAARLGRTLQPGKYPVHILQEFGWAPGPVWTDGKSRPHRDSIPDRPAHSQSLYRLNYPAQAAADSRLNLRRRFQYQHNSLWPVYHTETCLSADDLQKSCSLFHQQFGN